ncbi:DUF3558 family protein [Actinocrispum sp. NPDC049592]|uniref:DUF3558 family protein n=1 Tax=Actinocrispum sp. NPDC049592 TaxID=3154835 RepID=UPI0034429F44
MRKSMVTGLLLVAALTAACGQKVQGSPLADPQALVDSPTSSSPSSGSTKPSAGPLDSPPATDAPAMEQKLCKLLTFDDLPFKDQGANATQPTANTNINADFDQSCRWTYEIGTPQTKVGVQLYYRKTRSLAVKNPTGTYTVAGRPVSYQQSEDASCVLSMKYSDGNVGIGVIDSSQLFGPQCELGRKVAEIIIPREPAALS